ncbi:MAG: permease-like cell division protein FtsX [Bacteroidales bacterium]|jgi:cell division transport system permease protein|nr:permease-like cell division protein FtsX [Bacteroidales bacterium]
MVVKYQEDISKGRLRSSYLTQIVSISLVLFLLGLLGFVLINARALSDYFRESLSFSVMLDEDAKEADIRMLQKDLDAKHFVKSTEYISKEQAAENLKEDLGEDFLTFMGYNPLLPSIDVYLLADYTHPDSVLNIESYLMEYDVVNEVYFQESFLHLINENVKKISAFLLIFSGLLLFISLTIINNTIRLSVYSKRFIIRTMQLVGATRSFIRRPFLLRSIVHGIIAALLSVVLLMAILFFVEKEFYLLFSLQDIGLIIFLFGGIVLIGILINLVSTFFSVTKYLGISEDKLYY